MAADASRAKVGRRTLMALSGLALWPLGAAAADEPDVWPSLAAQIFPDRRIEDGAAVLAVEAPYRAEDAAVVPVTMRSLLAQDDARSLRALTLVIDANPSPLAARFAFAPGSGVEQVSTRVRVDGYTHFHAVAELSDGKLYMSKRYVKAAGGCSAPALKEADDGVPLGTLRLRQFATAEPPGADMAKLATRAGRREMQVMVRHPNYSGMQMDQVTRLYVPADFIQSLRILQGDALLLSLEGGISISENPTFRFDYLPNGAKAFRVEAKDSDGKTFASSFPVEGMPS